MPIQRSTAPLLALVVALVPLALDAYLPAFAAIGQDLGASISEVGLTLSIYIFVLAFGQLVGGPLSDRFGRGPILYAGLAVFVAGSLLVTGADSLGALLGARAVQAFGGGWVAVSVPAIVRDHTSGMEAARLFSLIALIMFLAPAIAPAIGTLLLVVTGWEGIFAFLAIYGIAVGILMRRFLFRRLPFRPRPPAQPLHTLVTNYGQVLSHGATMLLIGLQTLAFGVMMVYLTQSPFLLQEWLGLGNSGFSAVFALNVGALAGTALLNRRLLLRFTPDRILSVAVPFQCGAIVLLLLVTMLDGSRWLVIPALMLIVGAMGATGPNIQASVMQHYRELGGTAAALLGAVQFAGGGLISAASALLVEGEAMRVAASMLACSIAAVLLIRPMARRMRGTFDAPTG
jgi:MFS transporter, DHA1 family, multidrug resistance protein